MNKINSVIKFDLHIHSNASSYKEANGIVDQSTKENLDVLFNKLNQNEISLFAITDHNRFDAELYRAIRQKLETDKEKYPKVLNALAGIEFDVQLEENQEKCHIIAIFDANEKNCDQITNGLKIRELKTREEVYTRDEFEKILHKIALNVILIAEQRKGITHKGRGNASLSDSVENVESILKVGYFNALEVQKNHVEGILLNDLHELNCKISIFCGSDCHEWEAYPKHDQTAKDCSFEPSQAKMLPTFKGLLMALTSPNTRFDCDETHDEPIIKDIVINGVCLPLVNGINVIIGENGAGKTTLLDLIYGRNLKDYIKKAKAFKNITCHNSTNSPKIKYLRQGQLVQDFFQGKLFQDEGIENFLPINNEEFNYIYTKYGQQLKQAILFNIEKTNRKNNLKTRKFKYEEIDLNTSFFITVSSFKKFKDFSNIHAEPYNDIKDACNKIKTCTDNKYFSRYKNDLDKVKNILNRIMDQIQIAYYKDEQKIQIQNSLLNCIHTYKNKIHELSTQHDKKASQYKQKIEKFVDDIVEVIKDKLKANNFPVFPDKIKRFSSNKKKGFCFNCVAKYHDKDLQDDFLSYMFKKEFRNFKKIESISSEEKFEEAIFHRSKTEDNNEQWNCNLEKFIEAFADKPTKTITNDTGNQEIGNTLGEMSLAFYSYYTNERGTWDVLMIDQPEDNISNKNIRDKMINYLRNIQQGKQIIFVTHNPLLVVNMDVDNVIYLNKNNDTIEAIGGCLEYEDGHTNILHTIAESMDGGTETIERRLKAYGKNY